MSDARVCAGCFADADLIEWIEEQGGGAGCDFCGREDAATADLQELADYMRQNLETFYGYAGDQLPYDGREGGYQAPHWDTYDLLVEKIGLDLPRDNGNLLSAVSEAISSETWCEFDWLLLAMDDALAMNWQRFCEIVQHQRRFFFHDLGPEDDPDARVPSELLQTIAGLADDSGLVKTLAAGTHLWRARTDLPIDEATDKTLGPPLPDRALQSNRMNPPGIPMLYTAYNIETAVAEMPIGPLTIATFNVCRDLKVLDLSELPLPKGIFAGATQRERLGVQFLHEFVEEITKVVARDERVHIDYLPSQVVTEFFRFYQFSAGLLDGICFKSAANAGGRNAVLFLQQSDVVDGRRLVNLPNGAALALIDVSCRNALG